MKKGIIEICLVGLFLYNFSVCFGQTSDEFYNLGNSYKKSNDYEKAAYYYNKSLELDPKHSMALHNLSNTYFELGNLYYEKYQFDIALNYYNKSIKADSTNCDAYFGIGNINFNNQKYDEALINYRKAIKINPNLKKYLPDRYENIE